MRKDQNKASDLESPLPSEGGAEHKAHCIICQGSITAYGNGWSHDSMHDNRYDHEATPYLSSPSPAPSQALDEAAQEICGCMRNHDEICKLTKHHKGRHKFSPLDIEHPRADCEGCGDPECPCNTPEAHGHVFETHSATDVNGAGVHTEYWQECVNCHETFGEHDFITPCSRPTSASTGSGEAALKDEVEMTNEELDAELRSHGLDPDRLTSDALISAFKAGFNECRAMAMNIVDEHEGFLNRIESLEPAFAVPVAPTPIDAPISAKVEGKQGERRQARINCKGRHAYNGPCGEWNCDTCHPETSKAPHPQPSPVAGQRIAEIAINELCPMCRNGNVVKKFPSGWFHEERINGELEAMGFSYPFYCQAGKIYAALKVEAELDLPAASPSPQDTQKAWTDDELVKLVYEFNLHDSRQLIYEDEKDGIDIEVPTNNFRDLVNHLCAAWAAKGGSSE